MAILLNDNYDLQRQNLAFDARYLDGETPWASVGAAEAGIPTYRYTGLTVNIDGEEYWWKDGTGNGDLVPKVLGGTSSLSGATNGLQLLCSNTYVGLGGALTQNTAICGAYSLSLGNYVSGLTAISAVTPTFQITDEGVNSSLSWCHDQDTPHFDVCLYGESANSNADIVLDVDVSQGCFTASAAPNTICCSALSLKSTDSNVAIYNVHSTNNVMHYVKEACIASTKQTYESLTDSSNSALNIKSVMDYDTRSWEFCKDNAVILSVLSGGTARYGSNVTLNNDCDLAHKWYVDNATGALSGENGLTKDGDNIVLGGALTGATTVCGTTSDTLTLQHTNATDSAWLKFNNEGTIDLKVYSGTTFANSETGVQISCENLRIMMSNNANQQSICFVPAEMTIQDAINSKGLVYAGDYENQFTARSLVTKQYVSGVTSGATGAITSANNGLTKDGTNVRLGGGLTGATTIDVSGQQLTFTGGTVNITDATFNVCGGQTVIENSTLSAIGVDNGADCACIGISSGGFTVVDSFTDTGFKYLNNYCAAGKTNPRWIPDNAYVTGLTATGLKTASNGLCAVGNDVKLGGTLTGNTSICLGGGTPYSLCVKNSGATTCTVTEFSPTQTNICTSNINSPFQTSRLATSVSATLMCHGFTNCYTCLNMSNSLASMTICGGNTNAQFTFTDATTTKRGIQYGGCYHSTYDNRSLVDKEYVVSQTSGITANAITGATNGLCKVGQDVILGGDLTGNTTICTCSNDFKIVGQDSNSTFEFFDNDAVSSGWNIENCVGVYETTAVFATCESGGFASSIIEACNTTDDCKAVLRIQDFGAKLMYFTGSTSAALILDGTSSRFTDTYRQQGLIYGGDYENNFVSRSLVTAQYVTGITSGITGAFTSANNGLCSSGQVVSLGGGLTGATTVCGVGNSNSLGFSQQNTTDSACIKFNGEGTIDLKVYSGTTFSESETGVQIGCEYVRYGATSPAGSQSMNFENGCMLVTDTYNSQGLVYAGDYENQFTARSLVTAQYVTGITSGITGAFTTANNGLCSSGQVVSLGGTLTGDTTIDADTNLFEVCGEHDSGIAINSIGGSRTASVYAGSGATITGLALTASAGGFTTFSQLNTSHVGGECATLCSLAAPSGTESSWRVCDGASANEIKIEASGEMTITDAICSKGLIYGGDYETNFVDRSLVTAQYVTACVNTLTGVTSNAITGATNGLTELNNDVKLGGVLSEETVISGGTQTMCIGTPTSCLSNFYVNTSGALQHIGGSIFSNASSTGTYKGGNACIIFNTTDIVVHDDTSNQDGIKYADCISTGFTNSCSVVDKGYVDDNANILQVCQISSGYTTVRSDDLIVVSGISTNEINLYPTPELGQRLTVVDICGNALAEPIVVNGNGNLINNSTCSSINTDYGSVTYVYNGIFWSAVAFIN